MKQTRCFPFCLLVMSAPLLVLGFSAQAGYESGDGSGVDGFGGECDACREVEGKVGDDEDGSSVEEDDVAAGASLAGEDGGKDGSVGLRVASSERLEVGALEAE